MRGGPRGGRGGGFRGGDRGGRGGGRGGRGGFDRGPPQSVQPIATFDQSVEGLMCCYVLAK